MSEFDVFLCHNSQDKPEVKKIARQLQQQRLKPWLDECELQPGLPWQRELERQIQNIKSAAVFVGQSGVGPWQQMEIEAYLRRFVNQKSPVIPVLLPNAPQQPELPLFLGGMTWVDFRCSEPNPMEKLIWGITGKKPPVSNSSQPRVITPSVTPEEMGQLLPKTLQTWEENHHAFIENLLCILNKQLDASLFFINSFLLSSKFIEEFVLDEPDLKDKLKDLAIKPVSDGICPLIACSEWCRLRFCDRSLESMSRESFN